MATRRFRSLEFAFLSRSLLCAEERLFRVRWAFFTLFSRWATHSIQEAKLERIHFSEAEFEGILQLLPSENPLGLLFEESAPSAEVPEPNGQVLATKGSTIRLDPSPRRQLADEPPAIAVTQDVWFDVIGLEPQEGGDWLVLVPAYGKCRLRRAVGTQQRALREPTEGSVGSRGIKSIQLKQLSLPNAQGRGIFAFLCWLGAQLDALALAGASFEEHNALISLLTSCPSLERLHLSNARPEILPQLLQAYETGACTASSLDLRFIMEQHDSRHVTRFFETLADPMQRMAHTVRELLFWDRAAHWPMADAEITAMRVMLANNTVLEYFERTCRPVHNDAYVALYRAFNHATIAIRPAAPRAKMAFLSVVSTERATVPSSVQLPGAVITTIFDMAAHRVQRRVCVGSYRSRYFE